MDRAPRRASPRLPVVRALPRRRVLVQPRESTMHCVEAAVPRGPAFCKGHCVDCRPYDAPQQVGPGIVRCATRGRGIIRGS